MRSRERKLSKGNKLLARGIFLTALLAIWEIAARSGRFPDALFPGLMDILKSFIDLLINGELIMKTAYSIGIVFLAMAISLMLAAALVAISRISGYAREFILLLQSILSPLPGIAVLPIVILWLGVSRTSMVLIMVHATLWPLWSQLDLSVERLSTRYG